MLSMLPIFYKNNKEFSGITSAESKQFDAVQSEIEKLILEAFIATASEVRLSEWEKELGLSKAASIEERRMNILAKIQGQGKVNEEKICEIVRIYTGGEATVTLDENGLKVEVLPPEWGEIYDFGSIISALSKIMPAHLSLTVDRKYSAWGEILEDFKSWSDLKEQFASWPDVKLYLRR